MDIRNFLLAPLAGSLYTFEIKAKQEGILAGTNRLQETVQKLGLDIEWMGTEGMKVKEGTCVFRGRGDAWEVAFAEEQLLGCIGKTSGVATAAAEMVSYVKGKLRIVCGAWKKIPVEIRQDLREAIATGGAGIRIVDEPFVYLDKNYIRMFGSISSAVRRARALGDRVIVVQVRGETGLIVEEAMEAIREGANILMIDTGQFEDLLLVKDLIVKKDFQGRVKIAFSGGVKKEGLDKIIAAGADIVDVGRAIIDAPLLDFSLDVIKG